MSHLNYKSLGHGEPVIILHGLFGMLDNWASIAKSLVDHYRVILVDQRNHGKSFHDTVFNYKVLAKDLKILMTDIGLESAHIIGHSMGGKTAMQFAHDYPEMTRSLIVLDIAPKTYEGSHQEIFKAIFSLDLSAVTSRSEADSLISKGIKDLATRQFILKSLGRNGKGNFEWKTNFKGLYDNYEAILSNISMKTPVYIPSLFVKGGKSNYITNDDKKEIMNYFPTADIVCIDAGHWIHAEQPEELIQTFITFIERN